MLQILSTQRICTALHPCNSWYFLASKLLSVLTCIEETAQENYFLLLNARCCFCAKPAQTLKSRPFWKPLQITHQIPPQSLQGLKIGLSLRPLAAQREAARAGADPRDGPRDPLHSRPYQFPRSIRHSLRYRFRGIAIHHHGTLRGRPFGTLALRSPLRNRSTTPS